MDYWNVDSAAIRERCDMHDVVWEQQPFPDFDAQVGSQGILTVSHKLSQLCESRSSNLSIDVEDSDAVHPRLYFIIFPRLSIAGAAPPSHQLRFSRHYRSSPSAYQSSGYKSSF